MSIDIEYKPGESTPFEADPIDPARFEKTTGYQVQDDGDGKLTRADRVRDPAGRPVDWRDSRFSAARDDFNTIARDEKLLWTCVRRFRKVSEVSDANMLDLEVIAANMKPIGTKSESARVRSNALLVEAAANGLRARGYSRLRIRKVKRLGKRSVKGFVEAVKTDPSNQEAWFQSLMVLAGVLQTKRVFIVIGPKTIRKGTGLDKAALSAIVNDLLDKSSAITEPMGRAALLVLAKTTTTLSSKRGDNAVDAPTMSRLKAYVAEHPKAPPVGEIRNRHKLVGYAEEAGVEIPRPG